MPSRRNIFSIDSIFERSSSTTSTVTASGEGSGPDASRSGAEATVVSGVGDEAELGKLGTLGFTSTRCHRRDIMSTKRTFRALGLLQRAYSTTKRRLASHRAQSARTSKCRVARATS